MLREKMLKNHQLPLDTKTKLENFRVSEGWCNRFVNRYDIKCKVLYGEAGSAPTTDVVDSMQNLREKLSDYPLDKIYNVDETALFFKLLPRRTYILPEENTPNLRGTKSMKAKDRVTAIICTNSNRSMKISISIIEKSRNPRSFRNETPPCYYFSNSKAWSNTFLFRKWLNEVFFIHSKCSSVSKVALIVYNGCSHNNNYIPDGVELFPLPPNVTSVHQTMNMGVIRLWKTAYKRLMLIVILKDVETRIERQQIYSSNTRGLNGLEQGYDTNMLDVCRLSNKAWNEIENEKIARCWVRAHCLSHSQENC